VKQISCGDEHTLFLLNDGTVKSCGCNTHGQLGLGDTIDKTIPTLIPGLNNIVKLWEIILSSSSYTIYKTLTNIVYGKK